MREVAVGQSSLRMWDVGFLEGRRNIRYIDLNLYIMFNEACILV